MNKVHLNNLPLWQFTNLSQQDGINHFVSGREGGESIGELGGLNLSYKVGDDPVKVMRNREALAGAFSIAPYKLVFPVQTHSNNIKVVTSDSYQQVLEDTDALITKVRGVLISVMSADCVPVLLYDPIQETAAAIHAGWRGTMGEIVRKSVEKMNSEFGSKAENLIAGIGPSICAEVYEVGEEVINAVEKVYGTKTGIITNERNGKGYCNLWEANWLQLTKAGVKPENIEIAGICTYKNADLFFSARKSGNKAGRFAAGIMIK